MNTPLLLALPLLAGVCLANSLPPDGEYALPEAVAPAPAATPGDDAAPMRALYHNALQRLLNFVHDKASADAAAERVKALLATPRADKLSVAPDCWLFVYFGSDCFGSQALMDALRPLLPANMEKLEQYRATLSPFMDELQAHLCTLADQVEQVENADTAAAAAEALNALPAFVDSWGKRADAALENELHGYIFSRDEALFTLAVCQLRPLPAMARLHRAFGLAQARQEGGFPALAEACEQANRSLASLTGECTSRPELITPERLAAEERLVTAIHEWMSVAATVCDKASADAAADWLENKKAELGGSLVATALSVAAGESPCSGHTGLLCLLLEYSSDLFALATPCCYGSEKLERCFREDRDEPMQEFKPELLLELEEAMKDADIP